VFPIFELKVQGDRAALTDNTLRFWMVFSSVLPFLIYPNAPLLTHSGRFSCAVDSFLELTFAIFRDSLQHVERNECFQTLFEACEHLQSCNVETDMVLIREPFWAYLRQHCNSFAIMSADAVFSDILKLSTVGVMTQELQSLVLVKGRNQSVCSLLFILLGMPKLG